MYVTLVFRTKGTRLMKPTLCLVLLSLAVLVGVVRVTEHRNHWNDVLAGFVTGGAIAAFLVSCVINNFRPTKLAVQIPTPPPQRPEPPISLPLLSLPRVESPLEKLSGFQVRGEVKLEILSLDLPREIPLPCPAHPEGRKPLRRVKSTQV
ncbi:hypothetical protein XENOCAPTIV_020570 [Xenoophorus captivus]|uniref:Phosphatidic acid phosphatase type 2/haloperoxidase domain-containing protein n=1 Tax=Xenoophorus captivus TaxID=1517983 RepID=A0ABV0Q5M7_9TELE